MYNTAAYELIIKRNNAAAYQMIPNINLITPLNTTIQTFQSNTEFKYKNILLDSLNHVIKYDTEKIPAEFNSLLRIDGMSGGYYRLLINNVVKKLGNDARYLEVGSFKGSTACAAMYNNKCKVLCIDNWSEFGGPKEEFNANISIHKNNNVQLNLIERDFRKVDYSSIGKYNVYLFDGPHSHMDHYDGIIYAQPALDESHILVVDDWNWEKVSTGTLESLNKIKSVVQESLIIKTSEIGDHPKSAGKHSKWHNGYYIAVVSKNA